mmetsp:Transcript_3460/g.5137  ORF Transcript_3460/g.5137 Transcript_3460/m.5137 type:complete len:130 (+) Transcript_3460:51-440(+)
MTPRTTILLLAMPMMPPFTVAFIVNRIHRSVVRNKMSQDQDNTQITTVEVCGFKDCKRVGGGPKLQKLMKEIIEEQGLADSFQVMPCDCQGECGYGPNIVIDGKLINAVSGRSAVVQALGLTADNDNNQ